MALVLTRKVGEEIFIGSDVRVRLVTVKSKNAVRLAIEAPDAVPIRRGELRDRECDESVSDKSGET